MALQGAVIHPGNGARWYGAAYRLNGKLIGYERKVDELKGDKCVYRIKPIGGGADILVVGPDNLPKSPTPALDPKDNKTEIPGGKLTKEVMRKDDGSVRVRPDVSAVFRVAAEGLREKHPATVIKTFANVHDDAADGGTAGDTLRNFMNAMEELAATCRDLDYFAYSGHGVPRGLASAGLNTKSKRYPAFVEHLRTMLKPRGTIIFYACSCGASNGIAQQLSAALPGITVWGHSIPGHGMTNPYKARCQFGERAAIADTFSREDFRKFRDKLKAAGSDLWRRFPWMSFDEILAEVQGRSNLAGHGNPSGLEQRPNI
jgi:hypothetical protein